MPILVLCGRPWEGNIWVYFMVIWYISWYFGIFHGTLVYFMVLWYISWHFGIFHGTLVYVMVLWYISWYYGIFHGTLVFAFLVFFAFLVCCTKKNLATLLEN
jgi:hypothetical protein